MVHGFASGAFGVVASASAPPGNHDAVDGTIWFDDNKKSELLPPLGSP